GFHAADLAIGQEGTLGVVTEAVLRLRPVPDTRKIQAFYFPDFESGFLASIDLHELGPSLLDFIEPFEGRRRMPGGDDDGRPTLTIGFEGAKRIVDAQVRVAERIAKARRGRRAPDRVA